MKANLKLQDAGKQISNYKDNKSRFANDFDTTLRGWNASVKLFKQMYEEKNAALLACMQNDGLTIGCFNMDYLRENLPGRFNSKGVLCTLKKATEEQAAEVVAAGLLEVKELAGQKYIFCPVTKFTGRSFYNLFKSAITARKRGINETAKRAKAAAKQQRDAERIKKLQAELAKLQK